jgi:YidC/Oxa1 family membrane protein insertase
MERRVFLAICLSIVVLYAYQIFFAPKPAPTTPPAATTTAPTPAAPTPATDLELETSSAPLPAAVVSEDSEREITVRTAHAEIVLTNRGGVVRHWRLRNYKDGGHLVDLVPSNLPTSQPGPFSLRVDASQTTQSLNQALYKVGGAAGSTIDATQAPASITFEYENANGLRARKEFRFEPTSFLVTFSASVTDAGKTLNPWVLWGPGLGDVGAKSAGGSFFSGNYVQAPQAIYHRDGKVTRVAAEKVTADPSSGEFLFAGIDDHYFAVSAVKAGPTEVKYAPVTLPAGPDMQHKFVSFALRFDGPPRPVQFFVGAKEFEALRAVDPQLVYIINFGMFQFLVVPLLQALKWVYGFVGNYGWAIIILTILINLVMFPLRHKSLVSMRKMQLIQPEVKAIQERYAHLKMTDPARQKMNTEMMNLYRERGANPAAGCVPMLLTMPVLLAFYSLLSQSIELRGAPFMFWIHDLSQRDPYYVTPVLMGATMFWQQWMAPTTVDPAQQRVMMVMPVVFSLLFLGFPSGLAIYYLVSNLFQIGQQAFTNRVIGPPPRPAPAADRRMKAAGAGRTAAAEGRK